MHSRVKYVIVHGIASEIDGRHACIGSYHFIFEDEGCVVPPGEEEKFAALPTDCSLLYLAWAAGLRPCCASRPPCGKRARRWCACCAGLASAAL